MLSNPRRAVRCASCILATAVASGAACAQPLISETFDTGAPGWGVYNDGIRAVWRATTGNPGGCFYAEDGSGGSYWGFTAGPAFLGDRSCMYGGVIAFDIRVSHNTGDSASQPDIVIFGGGLTLVYDLPLTPVNVWVTRTVTLKESAGWRLTSLTGAVPTAAQFQTALASVTGIRFRSEVSTSVDTGSIDNVAIGSFLVAHPTSTATCPGRSAEFSVGVTGGVPPFTYQWRRNASAIDPAGNPSAATATLTLPGVDLSSAGSYDCVVTSSGAGPCNIITSNAATLEVRDCPYGSCPADYDASGGTPDTTDITAFFGDWLAGADCADADCSGGTPDGTDITVFFDAWLAGGC